MTDPLTPGVNDAPPAVDAAPIVDTAPAADTAPAIDTAPAVDTRPVHEPLARKSSRVGGVWVAAVLFAVILLLLLIFVLENGQKAEISFLGQHGHLPQGVALLLAAVFGILLVAIPGSVRIVQFRVRERQHRRLH